MDELNNSFKIFGRLSGMNEMINSARTNRFGNSVLKKKETGRCEEAILVSNLKKFEGPVSISVMWIEPNYKRDPDNIEAGIKFILDALVKTEKIKNDGQRWIKEIRHLHGPPDKLYPRVIVTLFDR